MHEAEQGSEMSAWVILPENLTDAASPLPKHFYHLHLVVWVRFVTLYDSTQHLHPMLDMGEKRWDWMVLPSSNFGEPSPPWP